MLEKIDSEDDITVDYFKAILDSVHLEEPNSHTSYSNIFDLHAGMIYLFYRHQYSETAILNVAEEIARGNIIVKMKDLFSLKTHEKAEVAAENY